MEAKVHLCLSRGTPISIATISSRMDDEGSSIGSETSWTLIQQHWFNTLHGGQRCSRGSQEYQATADRASLLGNGFGDQESTARWPVIRITLLSMSSVWEWCRLFRSLKSLEKQHASIKLPTRHGLEECPSRNAWRCLI
jgi:hypothetical protein